MNLIQRVMTLIRANLNDLIERAEDPEKMIKQLILDLNNQLIQVKTTVAQSLADQYLMEKRLQQCRDEASSCERRAQIAIDKGDDELAKTALQRRNSFTRSADETERQLEEQRKESDALKLVLGQLEMKIAEVTRERDVLLARHRRANAKEKLTKMQSNIQPQRIEELLNAIGGYVDHAEARAKAEETLYRESANSRLQKMEEDDLLESQLAELKARKQSAA